MNGARTIAYIFLLNVGNVHRTLGQEHRGNSFTMMIKTRDLSFMRKFKKPYFPLDECCNDCDERHLSLLPNHSIEIEFLPFSPRMLSNPQRISVFQI